MQCLADLAVTQAAAMYRCARHSWTSSTHSGCRLLHPCLLLVAPPRVPCLACSHQHRHTHSLSSIRARQLCSPAAPVVRPWAVSMALRWCLAACLRYSSRALHFTTFAHLCMLTMGTFSHPCGRCLRLSCEAVPRQDVPACASAHDFQTVSGPVTLTACICWCRAAADLVVLAACSRAFLLRASHRR